MKRRGTQPLRRPVETRPSDDLHKAAGEFAAALQKAAEGLDRIAKTQRVLNEIRHAREQRTDNPLLEDFGLVTDEYLHQLHAALVLDAARDVQRIEQIDAELASREADRE